MHQRPQTSHSPLEWAGLPEEVVSLLVLKQVTRAVGWFRIVPFPAENVEPPHASPGGCHRLDVFPVGIHVRTHDVDVGVLEHSIQ